MKKSIIIFCLAVICNSVNAQLVWTIKNNKSNKISYLFATDDKVPATYLDSIEGIFKCFNKSDLIITESTFNSSDITSWLLKKSGLPVGKSLHNYLTDKEFAMADSIVYGILKIKLEQLSGMKPVFISLLFENEFYHQLWGKNAEYQAESYFQLAGSEKGKKIQSLEPIQTRFLDYNDSTSLALQAKDFLRLIQNTDSLKRKAIKYNQLYKNGDIEGLAQLKINDNRSRKIDEITSTITNKNNKWIKQIEESLKKNSCFITIDLLFLPGSNGLIHLLRKDGYLVKPLTESTSKQ